MIVDVVVRRSEVTLTSYPVEAESVEEAEAAISRLIKRRDPLPRGGQMVGHEVEVEVVGAEEAE